MITSCHQLDSGRTRWHQHRTMVAQSIGFPSLFIFSTRAFICSFLWSVIFSMMKKVVGRWWSARYLALKMPHSQRTLHQSHIAGRIVPARSVLAAAMSHSVLFPSLWYVRISCWCTSQNQHRWDWRTSPLAHSSRTCCHRRIPRQWCVSKRPPLLLPWPRCSVPW